jgi:hypothetical protein
MIDAVVGEVITRLSWRQSGYTTVYKPSSDIGEVKMENNRKKVFCRFCEYITTVRAARELLLKTPGDTISNEKYVCIHPENIVEEFTFFELIRRTAVSPERINFKNSCSRYCKRLS